MKYRLQYTIIFPLLLAISVLAKAEIVVVVNAQNPVQELSQRELVDLYMGRNQFFPDNAIALRLDQAPDSSVRAEFYTKLVNKSVAKVNAYWAKLLFTGRASPPMVLSDSESILQAIRNNRNAIGYMQRDEVDDTVKVVASVQ